MSKYSFFYIFTLVLLITNCQDNPNDNSDVTEPVVFETYSDTWFAPFCDSDTTQCAKVEASFPIVTGAPSEIGQGINDSILKFVKYSISSFHHGSAQSEIKIEDLVTEFFDEYQLFTEDFPDFEMPWTIEIKGKILYQSEKIISIQMEEYSYTGGAHPNYNISLLNFDLVRKRVIQLDDLITDPEKLKLIASEKFRKARNIQAGDSFESAGFLFGDSFSLPANFALTEEGLFLFYNPYEVGAYVLGPTSFTIPYREIETIMEKP